jgi:hypothetical protein
MHQWVRAISAVPVPKGALAQKSQAEVQALKNQEAQVLAAVPGPNQAVAAVPNRAAAANRPVAANLNRAVVVTDPIRAVAVAAVKCRPMMDRVAVIPVLPG